LATLVLPVVAVEVEGWPLLLLLLQALALALVLTWIPVLVRPLSFVMLARSALACLLLVAVQAQNAAAVVVTVLWILVSQELVLVGSAQVIYMLLIYLLDCLVLLECFSCMLQSSRL
jgi:hypothetical protein